MPLFDRHNLRILPQHGLDAAVRGLEPCVPSIQLGLVALPE